MARAHPAPRNQGHTLMPIFIILIMAGLAMFIYTRISQMIPQM